MRRGWEARDKGRPAQSNQVARHSPIRYVDAETDSRKQACWRSVSQRACRWTSHAALLGRSTLKYARCWRDEKDESRRAGPLLTLPLPQSRGGWLPCSNSSTTAGPGCPTKRCHYSPARAFPWGRLMQAQPTRRHRLAPLFQQTNPAKHTAQAPGWLLSPRAGAASGGSALSYSARTCALNPTD